MADRPTRVNAHSVGGSVARHPLPIVGYFDCGPRYGTVRGGREDVLLFVVESGAGVFRVGDATHRVSAGEAAVWLPDSPQDYRTCPSTGTWRFRFAHVMPRADWWSWLVWSNPLDGLAVTRLTDARAFAEASSALGRASELSQSPLPGADRLATNAIEASLLWCSTQAGAGRRVDPRVRAASEFARQNLDRRVSVDELADVACVSTPRLTKLFRESLGVSPARHAEELRLQHAAHLLATSGLSVKEVSVACGFHDPPHFSRRFRQRFGQPPTGYGRP
ncbi:MAG: helix-turn-helix domain-containing protein [Planctomycetota bacterium]